MALPQQFMVSPTRMSNGTDVAQVDDNVGFLEQAIIDIFGVPANTNITAPAFAITAGGVVTAAQAGFAIQGGSAGNVGLRITGDPNTGLFSLAADVLGISAGGIAVAQFVTATNGVNFFNFTPAATTNPIQIDATGTDTNIGINYETKGNGIHRFMQDNGATELIRILRENSGPGILFAG